MPENRQVATLAAFAYIFEITAQDDIITVFDRFMGDLFGKSDQKEKRERFQTLKELDVAALKLKDACVVLFDPDTPDAEVRSAIFKRVGESTLTEAMELVEILTRTHDKSGQFKKLINFYTEIRKFLPQFLKTVSFHVTPSGQSILEGWNFLKDNEGKRVIPWAKAPRKGMSAMWAKLIYPSDNKVDHRAYTLWALTKLHEGIKRHDLYLIPSEKWGDPRANLLKGADWEVAKPKVLRTLDLSSDSQVEIEALKNELHQTYMQVASGWTDNESVRFEGKKGKESLVLTGLDKLTEPTSLKMLKKEVTNLLPRIDLPELFLEVNSWTHCTSEFFHVSQGGSRVSKLDISISAVLIAEACNTGMEPMIYQGNSSLTRDRLTWVQQNYLRAETLSRANSKLVEYQKNLPLASFWGGGEVASADGLRFVVPVNTVSAGPNPKYFGVGRGVTYYNFTSDQFTGFHGIIIPGTIRDSLYILDGLLEQQTVLQPTEIMSDTAGYSDIVFGLFRLLGYQFSPRLADIGEARFWRIDSHADYGPLNKLAKHRTRLDLIVNQWEDLIRVAGSLKMGAVNASSLIRALQRNGRPTALGRAIGELGRIAKTIYLLNYLNDETYRRRILNQLNRGEGRHSLARALFYGKRGELYQRYQEGQEDQLSALGLVLNAIVLWNTKYMGMALDYLRRKNYDIKPEDVARLSPLGYEHINLLGRYHFTLDEKVAKGHLRPLFTETNN